MHFWYYRIVEHTLYPNSGEYNFICEELVKRWPRLVDESVDPTSSDVQCPYVSKN